jgi:hypothetical protein
MPYSLFSDTFSNTIVDITITAGKSVNFYRCPRLKKVVLENGVTLGKIRAFNGCEKLIEVTLSSDLIDLGEGTFSGCTSLKSINIPLYATKIGEKAFLESVSAGDVKEVTFTQVMSLQGGEYLLSLGCTGFEGDIFQAYHRLYDVLNVTVISDKDTVGYYDMFSEITVK